MKEEQTSELRKDYLEERYVIIAPGRSVSSQKNLEKRSPAKKEKTCHFCPSGIRPDEVIATYGPGKPWNIAVLDNIFPAVSLDNPEAFGKQELVIESPVHTKHLDELHEEEIVQLLAVYAERTESLSRLHNIEYVLIFKNSGGKAGGSVAHTHSQIFASGLLPPDIFERSQRFQAYRLQRGTCVYCDVIPMEAEGPRHIFEDEHVVAFTPYASMNQYEAWVFPKRHIDNVTELSNEERQSFAHAMKKILKSVVKLDLAYNFFFHQVVFDKDEHFFMKIEPRGSVMAGIELGSGIMINSVTPEEAAAYYRGGF